MKLWVTFEVSLIYKQDMIRPIIDVILQKIERDGNYTVFQVVPAGDNLAVIICYRQERRSLDSIDIELGRRQDE